MSTRANIKFEDDYGFIHIDRSHDGFPDIILEDIKNVIEITKGCWSGSEVGQLVSYFLGMNYDKNKRIQKYEPCVGFERAGDESYCYWVKYNTEKRNWEYGIKE